MLPSTADLRNTTFSPRHTVLTVAHSQMQLADFLAAFCGFSNLSFIVCSMGAWQWVNDTSGPLLPSSPRRAYLNPCAIKAGLSATFNIASQRGRDVAVLHTIICFIAITFRIICITVYVNFGLTVSPGFFLVLQREPFLGLKLHPPEWVYYVIASNHHFYWASQDLNYHNIDQFSHNFTLQLFTILIRISYGEKKIS